MMTPEDRIDLVDDMMNWKSYFELKALDNDTEASEYAEVLEYWIEELETKQ